MDLENDWDSWGNIHEEESQIKRIDSAKKVTCTPLSLDQNKNSGVFQGKEIRYVTSLEKCNCMDFLNNKKPCKHIYRLALELGLIEGKYASNIQKIINQFAPNDAIAKIDAVSDESQQLLKHFLYHHIYQKQENLGFVKNSNIVELIEHSIFIVVDDHVASLEAYGRNELNGMIAPFNVLGFKKNLKLEKLVEWVIATAPEIIPELTSSSIAVTIHPSFTKTKRKVYTHLNQKFKEDMSWLWE